MTEMDFEQCWSMLEKESFGRLAVSTSSGVDIFPINFLVHERALYFRTGPGSKLIDIAHDQLVAFEVDGTHAGRRWSVVVRGEAKRLSSDAEIEASGVRELHTATPSAKHNYVRIHATAVSGRQFSALDQLSEPL
jgi:uncharacterized protein